MVNCQGAHVEQDMILTGLRWSLAYPLRDRQLEEMRQEHGLRGRPLDDRSMVPHVRTAIGAHMSHTGAPSRHKLAHGRNVYFAGMSRWADARPRPCHAQRGTNHVKIFLTPVGHEADLGAADVRPRAR